MKASLVAVAVTLISFLSLLQVSAEEQIVPIGLMVTLTRDSATPGKDCKDGLEAARLLFAAGDRLGTHKLRFIYADTKSLPAVAVSEFQRLESVEQVMAVINQRSQTTMAINPLSRASGLALLGIAGQQDFIVDNPNAFRFWATAKDEAAKSVEVLEHWRAQRIAMLTAEDEYTLSVRDELKNLLPQGGTRIVYDVTINPAEEDFKSFAMRIRQSRPDAVLSNLTVPQNGAFVKKLRDLSVDARVLATFWASLPDFIESAGVKSAEGTITAVLDYDQPKFLAALRNVRADASPSAVGYTCFAALAAIFQAIERVQGALSRRSILDALLQLKEVNLPDGALALREREAVFPLRLKTWHAGQLLDVSP